MKKSILRILAGVFLFPLALVSFSLSVPPGDFFLFIIMLVIAAVGMTLSVRESRRWRAVWAIALTISILGGVLEIVAGKRIAQQRSSDNTNMTVTNR